MARSRVTPTSIGLNPSDLAPVPQQVTCSNKQCGTVIVDGPVTVGEFPLTCALCEHRTSFAAAYNQNPDVEPDQDDDDEPEPEE